MRDGIFGPHGSREEPASFRPRPGMLDISAAVLFRDEAAMLDFASTIYVEDGLLRTEFCYEPQYALVLRGTVSAADFSRLYVALDFPGITHFSAEVETVSV